MPIAYGLFALVAMLPWLSWPATAGHPGFAAPAFSKKWAIERLQQQSNPTWAAN